MGVGGSYSRSKLIYFINMTEQKLNDISQYFQKIGKIERANPKFEHYTTIILIVLREI
jgi:hypothetical protein